MDRTKQKSKKEKPNKHVDKEKSSSFVADVKTLKENIKIREILRTVKMNSSMRIKAPRGSKVMQNKDFHEGEDIFEDTVCEDQDSTQPLSATNPLVVNHNLDDTSGNNCVEESSNNTLIVPNDPTQDVSTEPGILHKSYSLSEKLDETTLDSHRVSDNLQVPQALPTPLESPLLRGRDRKLSLDHTMLSKRENLSQSEVDLHSIGKSPLERKSSFFRKKMDNFLKNTTEIFKKQSMRSNSSVQRRGSTCSRMSVSLHSLNENEPYTSSGDPESEALHQYNKEVRGSVTSLSSTLTRSNSSLSVAQSDRRPDQSEEESLVDGRTPLVGSQPLGDASSNSIHNLNDGFVQESLLNSRAISMSSGLDTATNPRRRKTSRSHRVTWYGTESLTDYFRRLIPDEKRGELKGYHSYQDFSIIPENSPNGPKTDSKGRRLSYQRAVSGEDPVLPSRYQDSISRRKKTSESAEGPGELQHILSIFAQNGVPTLAGFQIRRIPDQAYAYLLWAENETNLEEHYDWKSLSPNEEARQAVIKEYIHTEADHIRHLMTVVDLFIGVAHALQDENKLLELDTRRLFLNIPDVLNASMMFWEKVLFPMIHSSFENHTPFNTDLMAAEYAEFSKIFLPYETYMCHQTKSMDYLRSLSSYSEFTSYLTWCYNKNTSNRLQLSDLLVKPMQRLTKYSVILNRMLEHTEAPQSKLNLEAMVKTTNSFVQRVNRAIRQKEEMEKLEEIEKMIENYDVDCRDDEADKCFRFLNETNLKCPMTNCDTNVSRNLIYQADMRFKDCHTKEIEVRAILFTDMLLICKKVVKGNNVVYKMIRPKYAVERIVPFARYAVNKGSANDINGIIGVVLDDHNTAFTVFCLSELPKDPDPLNTYKIWDEKLREAKVSYDLCTWFHKYRVEDLADVEMDYHPEAFKKEFATNWLIERKSRERVAAMMHPNLPPPKEITPDMAEDFLPGRGPPILLEHLTRALFVTSSRTSRVSSFHNTQSTSSRNSRISSFQQSSATSHEDAGQAEAIKNLFRACSSFEHLILPHNPDIPPLPQAATTNSGAKNESLGNSRQTPVLILQHSSPHHSLEPRSASAGGSNTLRVSPQHCMGRSMPDLTLEPQPANTTPQLQHLLSASEKLYQSHQELLQRNRLAATQYHQYLTPDHRGSSYPPPSLTRASLKRGLAFSYSCKNPPLAKMGHVNSQSQMQVDTTITQIKVPQDFLSSTSADKGDKKKQVMRINKSGTKSPSPEPSKADKGFLSAGPSKLDDEDKPRTSDKSFKGKSDKKSKSKNDKSI